MRVRRRRTELPEPFPAVYRILADPINRENPVGLRVGEFEARGAATIFREVEWPERLIVNTGWTERMNAMGLIQWDSPEWIHRSAGPPEDPRRRVHSFRHAKRIGFVTTVNPLSVVWYRVYENPDKWPETKSGEDGFGGEVKHKYDLLRDDG